MKHRYPEWAKESTTPKGVVPSLASVTQGRRRCTCQPCAIESITPMGLGHTVLFGAIECAIGWGMETPCGWRGLSNVQCDGVMAHHVVWWRWVGAVPVCPPMSPCQGRIHRSFHVHDACVLGMETPLRGRVAPQGRIHHSPPHTQCVYFLVWKRRRANVRAGT